MECPKCHFKNPNDTDFCGSCGAPLFKKIPSPPVPDPERISDISTETVEMPMGELETGYTFAGRYQIIEKLGEGGMGKIYKALDKEIDAKVVLKLLKPEIAANKRTIDRFKNELKLARNISHKNICRMYDLDKDKESYYITMEYVPGQDLKSMISMTKPLSVAATLDIAKQVCEGLAEAHRLGVVHRDIKPGNIIIDKQGHVKIMDFGLARSVKGKAETDEGVIIGTPEYMSPEQVEGKRADQRSDIYSLGIVLFEMLTGRPPFEGETPLGAAIKHKIEPPPVPKDFNPEIPDELSSLILKCLEKQPEKRFQSAEELLEELNNIEKRTKIAYEEGSKKAYFSLKKINEWMRRNWIFMAALFMLVIVAGIVLFSSRKETPVVPRKKSLLERNYEEVLDLLVRTPHDYFGEVNFYIPRNLARTSVYDAMNKDSLTKKYAELARQELEKNTTGNPEDARFHASLGLAYAYLGRKQEAIREGEKAVELYPISKDAFDGTLGIWNLTAIYTVVGEFDESLRQLRYLLSIPCGNYFSVSMMRLDPTWDPLRHDPRFKRLLEENSKGPRFRIDPKKLAEAWD